MPFEIFWPLKWISASWQLGAQILDFRISMHSKEIHICNRTSYSTLLWKHGYLFDLIEQNISEVLGKTSIVWYV